MDRVEDGGELGISAVMQSGEYRWSIKITMVPCSRYSGRPPQPSHCSVPAVVERESQCGLAGGEVRSRSLVKKKKKIMLKGGRRMTREASRWEDGQWLTPSSVCEAPGYREVCGRGARGAGGLADISPLERRRFGSELFRPRYSVILCGQDLPPPQLHRPLHLL